MITTYITVIILIERQIQSSGRNSIFGVFVNPIMQKAATLILVLSESNLAEDPVAVDNHKVFLAKDNRQCPWQTETA